MTCDPRALGQILLETTSLDEEANEELGFNRTLTSVAASIGRFEGGLESPISGWITDRFGAKWIILFGVVFIGLGLG